MDKVRKGMVVKLIPIDEVSKELVGDTGAHPYSRNEYRNWERAFKNKLLIVKREDIPVGKISGEKILCEIRTCDGESTILIDTRCLRKP